MEWKDTLEKENKKTEAELEQDYKFIDQQLNLIEKNREELNEFRDRTIDASEIENDEEL